MTSGAGTHRTSARKTPSNRGRQRPGGWQRWKPGAPRAPAGPRPRTLQLPAPCSPAPQRRGSLGAVFPERDSALSLRFRASPSRQAFLLGERRPQPDGWTHGLLSVGRGLESAAHRPSCQAGGSLGAGGGVGNRLNRLFIKPRVPVGKEKEKEPSLKGSQLRQGALLLAFKINLAVSVLLSHVLLTVNVSD